jgi:iron-sulfur cluster repair protein YtfE (RIC family)
MDIIRFLTNQHHDVRELLNEIIVQKDASGSRSLLEKVSKMLLLHMQIEETIVYPAASQCFQGDPSKPSVLESFEEHGLARQCLSTLESTPPTDERFVARAKVLKSVLREHIIEEENELFPSLATKLHQSGIEMLGAEVERQLPRLEAESAPGSEYPEANSPSPQVAKPRRRATNSRGAKVGQTRRQPSSAREAKGSRKQATASGSATKRSRAHLP